MSIAKISKALLDMSRFDDEVLHVTDLGSMALAGKTLEPAQRYLMERIDGFRSLDQIFALSGNIVGVHGVIGKLLVTGYLAPEQSAARPQPAIAPASAATPVVEKAGAVSVPAAPGPSRAATATMSPPKAAISELDAAKRLLALEVRHLMSADAYRMQPRIEACKSISEIYALIVKLQRHLSGTGNATPNVALDRLVRGLEAARKAVPLPSSAYA